MNQVAINGDVILITGGARGLGAAYARRLAREGARIMINDLDAEPAEAVAAELRAMGAEAEVVVGDVGRPDDAKAMIAAVLARFGRIDGLINNAGGLRDRTFARMAFEDFEAVLRVHLIGSALVTHAAWPHFLSQRYGRVLFTISSAALWGNFGQSNYAAAKLGLVGLMNVLAREGAASNVKINALAPLAMTRLADGVFPEHLAERLSVSHVASFVAALMMRDCAASGRIFEVGGGKVRPVRFQAAPGVHLADSESLDEARAVLKAVSESADAAPTFESPQRALAAQLDMTEDILTAVDQKSATRRAE